MAFVAKYRQILSSVVCVSCSNLKTLVLLSSYVFCDNGDFLDEGFITDLLGLEWLAGAFLHLHECHFHMVRNTVAKF